MTGFHLTKSREYQALVIEDFKKRVYPLAMACAVIFGVFFAINVFGTGKSIFIIFDAIAVVLFSVLSVLVKRSLIPPYVGSISILTIVLLFYVTIIIHGGSLHGMLFFYCTIPFFAFYMSGTRIGAVYGLVMLAALLLLWGASQFSLLEISYNSIEVMAVMMLLLFTVLSAWFFERTREKVFDSSYESGVRHETLMEALDEVYYRVGTDGIIQEIGEAIFALTGFSPKDVENRPIATFYADPSTRDAYLKALKEKGSVKNYPIEILGKQGQHVMISMSSRMFFDDSGKPIYIEGLIRDITQEKKREEERKAHLEHLKKLGSIEDILARGDLEQSLFDVVQALPEMFAAERTFLIPLCFLQDETDQACYQKNFIAQADDDAFIVDDFVAHEEVKFFFLSLPKKKKILAQVLDKESIFPEHVLQSLNIHNHLMMVLKTSQDNYWLFGLHNLDFDEKKKNLLIDISKRVLATLNQLLLQRSLEAAAHEAEVASKAKGDFVATMSHELRTPLHGIIGLLDLMGMDAGQLSKEQQQNLTLAQASTQVLRSLIDDVLDLSKIESGNVEIQKQAFDLQQTLTDALIPFAMKARGKKIGLSLEMREVSKVVEGDMQRLRQVLLNLVGNALKFTMQGYVRIVATQDTESLYIHIEDSGIGIERDKQAEVFKPFTQVHNESVLGSNLQEKGTGLGTTISQYFIKMMGGELSLRSEPSVGSTMTICLPLQAVGDAKVSLNLAMDDLIQAPDAPAESAASDAATTKEKTWRVLLAEDDPVGRRVAVKRLERSGFDVETAADGIQAYEAWQSGEFDLVLTDVRMPGMNGLELTQKIRLDEQTSQSQPVIIVGLSAYALEDVKKDALACGMDAFITKPVDMQDLMQILEEKCEK